MFLVFFCKQKAAYEMRISDWRDVCSSYLRVTSSVEDARQLNTPLAGPEEERSHIIIIDNGPDHFGADNCRKLQQRFPDAHLVVLADEFQYDEVADRKSTRLNSSH